jgi:hypothetical protein
MEGNLQLYADIPLWFRASTEENRVLVDLTDDKIELFRSNAKGLLEVDRRDIIVVHRDKLHCWDEQL